MIKRGSAQSGSIGYSDKWLESVIFLKVKSTEIFSQVGYGEKTLWVEQLSTEIKLGNWFERKNHEIPLGHVTFERYLGIQMDMSGR